MKVSIGLTKTSVLGAILSSAVWVSTGALAQTATTADPVQTSTGAQAQTAKTADPAPATMATIANPAPGSTVAQAQTPTTAKPKAKQAEHKKPKPVAADPQAPTADVTPWWFHGTVEAGGRDFTNNPQDNGRKLNNQNSLAGYYQYTDVKPGAFGNFDISTGSPDGLYRIDAGGRNVGYDDQSYYFDASKAGEQYFNFYLGPKSPPVQHERGHTLSAKRERPDVASQRRGDKAEYEGGDWGGGFIRSCRTAGRYRHSPRHRSRRLSLDPK